MGRANSTPIRGLLALMALELGAGCVWKPVFNPPDQTSDAAAAADAFVPGNDSGRTMRDAAADGGTAMYGDAAPSTDVVPPPEDSAGTRDSCDPMSPDYTGQLADGGVCPTAGIDGGASDSGADAAVDAAEAGVDVIDEGASDAGLDADDGAAMDANDGSVVDLDASLDADDAGDDAAVAADALDESSDALDESADALDESSDAAVCEPVQCQTDCDAMCSAMSQVGTGTCVADVCDCVCL